MASVSKNFIKRRDRVRRALKKKSQGHPRLSVHRSSKHIYAQVIDDSTGKTIVSASTLDKGTAKSGHGGNAEAAKKVGTIIARQALDKKIKNVIFDRSGYQYHGCIKALADAMREQGLTF